MHRYTNSFSFSASWRLSGFIVIACLLAAITSCGSADRNVENGDESQSLRIVSLSPAISRTLIDLELDQFLVGRTPFCDSVDASIPIVGDLLDLNMEMLVRVRPTHVLVQPPASGIDPALVRVAREREWVIGSWHLDSVDDVRTIIRELPAVIAGDKADGPGDLEARAAALIDNIHEALRPKDERFDGSVLLVFGLEPVTVFGVGTYLDEVLTTLGGTNAVSHHGYPQFSLEDITRIQPEVVILIAPGKVDEKSPRQRLGAIGRLDIPAVKHGRLAVLDHPDGFLPSSGIIGVAEAMREILHTMQRNESPAGAP